MTTPGIWEAAQWGCKAKTAVVVNDESHPAGKRVIADCGTEEDARLIAASKDLLEVIEPLINIIHGYEDQMPMTYDDPEGFAEVIKAREAIAKAKGVM